jgi:hypothetical protein
LGRQGEELREGSSSMPSRRDAIWGGAAILTTGVLLGRQGVSGEAGEELAAPAGPSGVSVWVYVSVGAKDETERLQSFIDARSPGDTVVLEGNIRFTTIRISQDSLAVKMSPRTVLTKTSASGDGIEILGANVTLEGGSIVSPPQWDGENVPWTYAVVHCKGNSPVISGVSLVNVPRVGIGLRGVDNSVVQNCRIEGNYPPESWSGTETANFGIAIDPSGSAVDGSVIISGNLISSTVQGVFAGNTDGQGVGQGITITGNVFSSCWNHGVYVAGGRGVVVAANNFVRCQTPVAVTGAYHVVASNAMTTAGTGDQRDITGISLRDAVGCIVDGNAISGDAAVDSTVIDLRDGGRGMGCRDNIVANNVVEVRSGSSEAIRVGRDSSVECQGNLVQGNRIRGVGRPGSGLIVMDASPDSKAVGNQILNNSVVVVGQTNGIMVSNQVGAVLSGNQVTVEFNSESGSVVAGIALSSGSIEVVSRSNVSVLTAPWGKNLTFYAITEASGAENCRYSDNSLVSHSSRVDSASLLHLEGTAHHLDESGPGEPSFPAARGSSWRRTDGVGPSLYVKQTSHLGPTRLEWRPI